MIKVKFIDGTVISLEDDVNFWWVNQGQTFFQESKSGLISCRNDANGKYHRSLCQTKINDIIMHYSNQEIKAISTVTKECFEQDGRRTNECKYYLLNKPISKSQIVTKVNPLPNPPFNVNGNIQQSYLFPIEKDFFLKVFREVIEVVS